ncbi:MAG: hypothetical protein ABSB13_03175 [Candidatus Binatus sp.]|jgi:hypothetical protein|uniref:hypothetical protein n=1 Tax=Candidatus Binatus sp. TaxID=2811406 RepID=UPI003D0BF968
MKLNTVMKPAFAALVAVASASPLLATTYPDCQGWKPPPELKGKKALETNFVGPSGGAVIIIHIGSRILCESAESSVPGKERRESERQVLSGKKLKVHEATLEDFNVATRPDCYDFYDACHNPGFEGPDPDACAEYEARCR